MAGEERNPWEHDLWRVALAVPPEDVPALWHASARAIPIERHYLDPDPEGGDGILGITVSGDEQAEAVGEAKRLYAKAREAAGLPAAEPEVVGVRTPLFNDTLWNALLVEAETLAASGRPDLAVVRAQTGLEVYAKTALEQVFVRRLGARNGYPLARRCRVQLDRPSDDLLAAITGERASDAMWFSRYRQHLQRRNLVVHRGYSVSHLDAEESLVAVRACLAWLQRLWMAS